MVQQQQHQQLYPLIKIKEKKAIMKNGCKGKTTGSRRIFSPLFKLQVLDSYRQDADCQGNQRATARKYGIHRRQIQKWLQMETSLRLTVQQSNIPSALNLTLSKPLEACKIPSIKTNTKADSNKNANTLKEDFNMEEEYVNVDEISDSEDDETSSCSSYEKNDKALDLTSATLSKNQFYTSNFKLHVIEAFKMNESCRGDEEATAQKFGIRKHQVQKWLSEEELIKCEQRSISPPCLNLSYKREFENLQEFPIKRKCVESSVIATPSATPLCLVKNEVKPLEIGSSSNYPRIIYPSYTHENSFSVSGPFTYVHDYPLCMYQPWSCYYPANSTVRMASEPLHPKYSFIDSPIEYGFRDSVASKWMMENPLYLHEYPPSASLLSSYR